MKNQDNNTYKGMTFKEFKKLPYRVQCMIVDGSLDPSDKELLTEAIARAKEFGISIAELICDVRTRRYIFERPKRSTLKEWITTSLCRMRGHPKGPVYYTGPTATEPDMRCKDCGEEL